MSLSECGSCPRCKSPSRHIQTQLKDTTYNSLTIPDVISASWECGSEKVGDRFAQSVRCLNLEFNERERELVEK